MKIFISIELKSAYRLNGTNLEYAHISEDKTFDINAFDYVEPELIGDEEITFQGSKTTFNEAYAIITDILNS